MSKEWPTFPVGQMDIAGVAGSDYSEQLAMPRAGVSDAMQRGAPLGALARDLRKLEHKLDGIEANRQMRQFATGATRHTDEGKLDFEGFLSPLVLLRYAKYMQSNRMQADGQLRASDNWTKGIPQEAYAKSLYRHTLDVMLIHRGFGDQAGTSDMQEALCAVLFNAMGLLFERLKSERDAKRSS